MNLRRALLVAVPVLSLAACGDNLVPDDTTLPDAPAGFVPAAHAAPPQLVSLGGRVLAAPKVRAIFFANDLEMQTSVDQFLAQLAASSYWTTTTAEYGVGPLTVSPTIVTADPPPTTDTAFSTWLASRFDGTHAEYGAFDPDTVYSVFLPQGVVLRSPDGDSCDAYGAYHDEEMGTGGQHIVYALIPRCAPEPGLTYLDEVTVSTSHELAEAVTDPLVETTGAFGSVDDDHAIWGFTPGAENGDFCEYLPTAYGKLVGEFSVQRTWSNAAALAGHDPCVPAVAGPFVGAAPKLDEVVGMTDGPNGPQMTKGVKIPMGMSKTIDVVLWSDAETADVSVEAIDVAKDGGSPAELTFVWDRTTGHNGDTLHLTITRVRPGDFGGSEFEVNTLAGGSPTWMWWSYAAN